VRPGRRWGPVPRRPPAPAHSWGNWGLGVRFCPLWGWLMVTTFRVTPVRPHARRNDVDFSTRHPSQTVTPSRSNFGDVRPNRRRGFNWSTSNWNGP